jgi:parallel beta-helix repeat protein
MDSMDHFRERFEALKPQMDPVVHQTQAFAAHTRITEWWRPWWPSMACGMVILLGLALGSATPAHADVIQCGDVLGPGGRFELEDDLACGMRAVTVRDGAILDLKGHFVACSPGASVGCITLTGAGTQLLNGAVSGQFETVILEGKGGHTVSNVTTIVVEFAIVVESDHNQLINVFGRSEFNPAFSIRGSHNRLTGSTAHCVNLLNERGCIQVDGNENLLIDNFATSTTTTRTAAERSSGFWITGHNNVLKGNRTLSNEHFGIVVTGTGNRLTRNTALFNSTDLVDTHEDCDANRWQQNTFQTSRAGTTDDPACIRGQSSPTREMVQLP